MSKLRFFALFFILFSANSCTQIKMAVNSATGKADVGTKLPPTDVPKGVQNSIADPHFNDAKAIIVTVFTPQQYYVADNMFPLEVLPDVVEKRLRENPPENRLIYLNSEARTNFGDIVLALDNIRKADVENIALRVAPKDESQRQSFFLNVKIPAEPKDEPAGARPNPLMLVLSIAKDGKVKLNNEEMYEGDKTGKLAKIFKQREDNGIFRAGTNDIEKTVFVKASRSNTYRDVVNLIDIAAGAGASPIYLQIDDLDM